MRKTIKELLKHSELDGFFSNHSLRRLSTTRLFNAGVDRKLVKEFTGHASNVLDQYQITSHDQRKQISNIIADRQTHMNPPVTVENQESDPKNVNNVEIQIKNKENVNQLECTCTRKNVNLHDKQGLGQLIHDMLEGRKYGKAMIKLEIELSD